MKITKSDVLTFLGVVGSAIITALLTRIQSKNDMREAVSDILAEERRQINESSIAQTQANS